MVGARASRPHRTPPELSSSSSGRRRRKGLCVMRTMKRRMAIAVTAGVWIAAVGSAAALTYDLNRPLRWVSGATHVTAASQVAREAPTETVSDSPPVLYIPTITIVAQVPRRPVTASVPAAPAVSPMRCADWRELDMGSGRVQVCE